ncbi:hypothetical protein N7517_008838 [Penicillium concentricum]|uniref:Pleiotropic ABC efflux transporter N-terminal domain-containing protein n=1 Tax=Penicillium concentricum TaxID=293559 RepID=A0A9W9V216_9EURO|nr:uncharacterized protein N7517_008838 [Penicillium concentricum]KAJ5365952.1 hypothetical protein N7517_008838 [Penicillium concentricum]
MNDSTKPEFSDDNSMSSSLITAKMTLSSPKEDSYRSRHSATDSSNRKIDSQKQLFDSTGPLVTEDASRGAERDLPCGEAGVHKLAMVLNGQFTSPDCHSPFDPEKEAFLDPNSPDFKARDWAKAFYNVRYTAEGVSPRRAGIAFHNLNVTGYGAATDYQMSP